MAYSKAAFSRLGILCFGLFYPMLDMIFSVEGKAMLVVGTLRVCVVVLRSFDIDQIHEIMGDLR